ncbi:hypothetical protein ACP70R_004687 [Stipagrostis hirtigluma subsp. patula]
MDAMELAATRHGCKVCGKSFPCGRSLGGHMRSHLSLGEAAAEADAGDELRRVSENGGRYPNGVAVGYGLRENPRKTRRLSDFADEEEEDGGDGDGEYKACRECGKLFASWRLLSGHMLSHASGGRDRDEEEDVDGDEEFVPEEAEAEAEAEEAEMVAPMEAQAPSPVTVLPPAPRRRRRSMRVAAPVPAPPPVLSEFEKEQEDVARCLLMLSQDTRLWRLPVKEEPFEREEELKKKATKQRRNGYAYDNSNDDSALLQRGEAKIKIGRGNGVARSRKRSSPKQQCEVAVATKRTRYECPGCGKVFSSYQALGGHRASHKRINTSCSAPKVAAAAAAASPAPEPSAETYTSFSTLSPSASPDSVAISIGKARTSAAADKRSHMMADDGELHADGADQEQHPVAVAAFLDLNFPPAPPEEA